MAEFPPPATITSKPSKKGPSQMAQYATPLPKNSSSPGTPNFLGLLPVAMIIDFAL